MARKVQCPKCGKSGAVAPSDDTFSLVLGHRVDTSPVWRCTGCGAGLTLGFFSGLVFGSPGVVRPDLWELLVACIDHDRPVPPSIVCEPLPVQPGYAFLWESQKTPHYQDWYRSFGTAKPVHNDLAGTRIGGWLDVDLWTVEHGVLVRASRYAGFPCALTAELKIGRLSNLLLTFIVAHPEVGFRSDHMGLTVSSEPESTAHAIVAAVRESLIREGFASVAGINHRHPETQYFRDQHGRERTLLLLPKVAGREMLVLVGAPEAD
ncbi:hypothetical protein L6R46_07660 [Myxococcota bacterium]|nr:hypothetical protein [Myxococcota bacterium]